MFKNPYISIAKLNSQLDQALERIDMLITGRGYILEMNIALSKERDDLREELEAKEWYVTDLIDQRNIATRRSMTLAKQLDEIQKIPVPEGDPRRDVAFNKVQMVVAIMGYIKVHFGDLVDRPHRDISDAYREARDVKHLKAMVERVSSKIVNPYHNGEIK